MCQVSEKFSPLTLGNAETQDITMLDGSTALARALMVESNLTLQIMLPHVARTCLVRLSLMLNALIYFIFIFMFRPQLIRSCTHIR
jgi:hypothetical protein